MSTRGEIVAFAKALSGLFSDPLRGITKKRHLVLAAESKSITPGLQYARLVICSHNSHRAWTRRSQVGFQPLQIDNARPLSRDEPVPVRKVVTCARQHTRMLRCRDPDLGSVAERLSEVMQHGVVRFRRSRSPHDLERTAAEEGREPFSGGIKRPLRARSDAVRARRIPNELLGRIQPSLPGNRKQRSRRVVVEIH